MYLPQDRIREPLHVVTAIFNPIRYKSRWKHYQRFARHIVDSGAILHTVEARFGEREAALDHIAPAFLTDAHPYHEQNGAPTPPLQVPHTYTVVQTDSEVWLKENLLNIGFARLPDDAKYIAWVDADVAFARPNWAGETIHQLQHYAVVQMFSDVQDLGPQHQPIQMHRSFMTCYLEGLHLPGFQKAGGYSGGGGGGKLSPHAPYLWHPGFAWAARRHALDSLGGLLERAVLGAGDNHMAHALIGRGDASLHHAVSAGYRRYVKEWEHKAEASIRRNVGVVSGLLSHYWHGKKVNRKYWDRWRIITERQFDPYLDLKKNVQGVLQLQDRGTANSRLLRDQIRTYFRERHEDSIDLD